MSCRMMEGEGRRQALGRRPAQGPRRTAAQGRPHGCSHSSAHRDPHNRPPTSAETRNLKL